MTPVPGKVTAAVEDDYHCMAVTLHHDGAVVTHVDAVMDRAPWTTCPGAPAVLGATFTGVALSEVTARRDKQANCTHLHDLAVLAAAHTCDSARTEFDLFVADAVDGIVTAEIWRDGAMVLRLMLRDDVLIAPEELRGVSLMAMRDWVNALPPPQREAARLLQWGTLIAHGRAIPLEQQSDATRMPPNCYTFQPERAAVAKRVGQIFDFSDGSVEPLEHFSGEGFGVR